MDFSCRCLHRLASLFINFFLHFRSSDDSGNCLERPTINMESSVSKCLPSFFAANRSQKLPLLTETPRTVLTCLRIHSRDLDSPLSRQKQNTSATIKSRLPMVARASTFGIISNLVLSSLNISFKICTFIPFFSLHSYYVKIT